ncbi:hypothetical protein [Tardiphaga sp. 803_E3_N1_3]
MSDRLLLEFFYDLPEQPTRRDRWYFGIAVSLILAGAAFGLFAVLSI